MKAAKKNKEKSVKEKEDEALDKEVTIKATKKRVG